MSTLESGNQAPKAVAGTIQAQIDPGSYAVRASHRPLDHTLGGVTRGHYRVYTTGAAGSIAAGIQNSLRYTGTGVLVVSRVYATIDTVTTVTVQAIAPLKAYVVRGFTVADTTNATAVTLSATGSGSMRTGMENISSILTIYQASASATVCSGGTGTSDDNPFGVLGAGSAVSLGIVGTAVQGDLFNAGTSLYCAPIVLSANEGIRILWGTTIAVGTARLGVGYDLTELAAY